MTDTLTAGQQLHVTEMLTTGNGQFNLVVQGDGNIVLYYLPTGYPIWASGTWHKGVAQLIMQDDGNLVAYNASHQPVWATNTWNHSGAWAKLEPNGRLVVYGRDGNPLWQSGPGLDVVTGPAHVTVEFLSASCGDTEDWMGADTLYIEGSGVRSDGQAGQVFLTAPPVWINNGETKPFSAGTRVAFDGSLAADQWVVVGASAWDEDAGKDWARNKEWIDTLTTTVLPAVTGVVAGIFAAPAGVVTAGGAAVAAYESSKRTLPMVRDGLGGLIEKDKDDLLGTMGIAIAATGPASETKAWQFNRTATRWWDPLDTSWKYTVAYQVTRRPQ
jgi:hypothetical protein